MLTVGGYYVVAALPAAAQSYLATQATISVFETGVETGLNLAIGEEVTLQGVAGSLFKNGVINVTTGGIGGKGNLVVKVAAFGGRQAIEISGESAWDVAFNISLECLLALE